jgi:glycerophosphoryl diester phosphodiesterase
MDQSNSVTVILKKKGMRMSENTTVAFDDSDYMSVYKNRVLAHGVYRRAAGAILLCGLCGGFIMACAYQKTTPKTADAWQGKYPIVVTAHRGFSGQAPENTPAAFQAAIEIGADMVELDVHLTRNNEVVVIHDDTLERTTNGKGNVAEKTLAELKTLDAGSWFNSHFAGERIQTLAEVLDIARNRILVNIELKKGKNFPYTMEELADRTLAVVEKAGMTGQVLFSSFDPAAVNRIKKKAPLLPIALIVDKPWEKPEDPGDGTRYPTLNCRTTVLNEGNIRRAHTAGIRVHVWTVNTREAMEKFLSLDVDGIITNHPDILIDLVKGKTLK